MPVGYLQTPIGCLKISATQRRVTGVGLVDAPGEEMPCMPIFQAKQQLEEYFAGKRKEFSVVFAYPPASELQIAVWDALQTIPYGKTITYGQLAAQIGKPTAVRAVATAVGQNPLMLLLPCHRVVASDGIGGFHWDIGVKKFLLELEK